MIQQQILYRYIKGFQNGTLDLHVVSHRGVEMSWSLLNLIYLHHVFIFST